MAGAGATDPHIVLTPDGAKAVASWQRDFVIQTAIGSISGDTGIWSPPADLSAVNSAGPITVISSDGSMATTIWVINSGGVQTASATISGNSATWSTATTLTTGSSFFARIKASADGSRLTAAWYRNNGSNLIVQAVAGLVSGNISSFGTIADVSQTGQSATFLDLACSTDAAMCTAVWRRPNGSNDAIESSSGTSSFPTPTPTPSSTPTVTPTHSATPTATPEVTPTSVAATPTAAATGTVPPPVLATPPSPITRNDLPRISGNAPANSTVEIYVDGILFGTTTALGDGTFSFSFNESLAPGKREITAFAVTAEGRSTVASLTINVLGLAPNDFDADGVTDIALYSSTGKRLIFSISRSGSAPGPRRETAVLGTIPAPGDYNGDGYTDPGAVSVEGSALIWRILTNDQNGGFNSPRTVKFGSKGDTILLGCNLITPHSASLVTLSGRTIRARDLSSKSKTINVSLIKNGDPLGCGDTNGDGVDEIFFAIPGNGRNTRQILTVNLKGRQQTRKSVINFGSGFIVRKPNSEVPLVALLKGGGNSERKVWLETVSGSIRFPLIRAGDESVFSSGIFKNETGDFVSGVFWHDKKRDKIIRRLIGAGTKNEPIGDAGGFQNLLKSGRIVRTR